MTAIKLPKQRARLPAASVVVMRLREPGSDPAALQTWRRRCEELMDDTIKRLTRHPVETVVATILP